MPNEYEVELFRTAGFQRKTCPSCKTPYWTQGDPPTCGETPCKEYDFLGHSPMKRPLPLRAMREEFLSFFESKGHTRIKRYPIVARWRDDVFFTQASVYPFQPYVIDGVVDPPANPLCISQPCARFNDVDNVGRSGEHFTMFEMLAHHAFNRKNKEIYWTDRTVELCHEFFTDRLGVEGKLLTYKESLWEGGGNSGPCLEVILGGAEVATLVFMQYKDANGNRIPMETRVVDTGYGLERLTWVSQATPSAYEAVFGDMLTYIKRAIGAMKIDDRVLGEYSKVAGMTKIDSFADVRAIRQQTAQRLGLSVEELMSIVLPLESAYAVLDHARTLMMVLADGVVPSNSREGYFARLLVRRGMRAFRTLDIDMKLTDLVTLFVQMYMEDFPEVFANRTDILRLLDVEQRRYEETLRKGRDTVRRVEVELKGRGAAQIDADALVELYDSHGLPPEIVKEFAEMPVDVPDDFFTRVASRHALVAPKEAKVHAWSGTPPPSKLRVYEDMKKQKFFAKVLAVEGTGVVLDQTFFYPEGGGQEADHGTIRGYDVIDVQQIGESVVHFFTVTPSNLVVGKRVKCEIDWDRRQRLKRHHTATHITLGAARKVLGNHVWQSGAHKGEDEARLDITHFDALTADEVRKIERLANDIVLSDRKIITKFVPRELAERKYGFRLYQGGSVPGAKLRVVEIPDWDIEACGGTHCARTSEAGLIKILRTTRIQDGVDRLEYVAGAAALEHVQRESESLAAVRERLGVPANQVAEAVGQLQEEVRELRKRAEISDRRTLETALKEGAEASTKVLPLGDRTVEVHVSRVGAARLWQGTVNPGNAGDLKRLAATIIQEGGNVVAFAARNGSGSVLIARSVDVALDCLAIARTAAAELGGGGGGAADFAQGGGPNVDRVGEALATAVSNIRDALG
ncbi:MAG: alanine--tRNA ligase [Methanobacteriota archaeon]|nr:MAG: alanine--tRNA ligase [Euryarchaeota archaeon]